MSEFFYTGARRGEILDAVVYVLTHGEGPEGIIVLTGDAGSGVSTLCRSLVKRLPARMHAVYIPQPPHDTAGLFDMVARELASRLTGGTENNETESDTAALDGVQTLLERLHSEGTQTVLVFDEAQQMTAEMLKEIRVLYELTSSQHKLLQIVLAGQRELDRILASPSLHDLKGRIAHWYRLDPLNPLQVAAYLASGEGVARTRGVTFNSRAIKTLGVASGGILSALDRLAEKSSSMAVSGNAKEVTEEHVRKAIDESEGRYKFNLRDWSKWHFHAHNRSRASFAASLMLLAGLGWLAIRAPSTGFSPVVASTMPEGSRTALSVPAAIVATSASVPAHPPNPSTATPQPDQGASVSPVTPKNQAADAISTRTGLAHDEPAPAVVQQGAGKLNVGGVKLAGFKLLEQRVESTIQTMETVEGNKYTIQLFSTENIQPDRMERFLIRARSLVDLSNLHVHIVKNGDRAKFRVTFGIYPSRADAVAAIEELPEKYQTEFHPELFAFADLR